MHHQVRSKAVNNRSPNSVSATSAQRNSRPVRARLRSYVRSKDLGPFRAAFYAKLDPTKSARAVIRTLLDVPLNGRGNRSVPVKRRHRWLTEVATAGRQYCIRHQAPPIRESLSLARIGNHCWRTSDSAQGWPPEKAKKKSAATAGIDQRRYFAGSDPKDAGTTSHRPLSYLRTVLPIGRVSDGIPKMCQRSIDIEEVHHSHIAKARHSVRQSCVLNSSSNLES